jgi:hypothetical protein
MNNNEMNIVRTNSALSPINFISDREKSAEMDGSLKPPTQNINSDSAASSCNFLN